MLWVVDRIEPNRIEARRWELCPVGDKRRWIENRLKGEMGHATEIDRLRGHTIGRKLVGCGGRERWSLLLLMRDGPEATKKRLATATDSTRRRDP